MTLYLFSDSSIHLRKLTLPPSRAEVINSLGEQGHRSVLICQLQRQYFRLPPSDIALEFGRLFREIDLSAIFWGSEGKCFALLGSQIMIPERFIPLHSFLIFQPYAPFLLAGKWQPGFFSAVAKFFNAPTSEILAVWGSDFPSSEIQVVSPSEFFAESL